MEDFDQELIAHLKEHYKDHPPKGNMTIFNIMDFIFGYGSSLEALMYSRLFWPEFVVIDDMVFLKETIQDESDRIQLKNTLDSCEGNKQEVEKSLNFVEIPYCFHNSNTEEDEDNILVERIADMWRARLVMVFPDRDFKVDFTESDEIGPEVTLTFYQY